MKRVRVCLAAVSVLWAATTASAQDAGVNASTAGGKTTRGIVFVPPTSAKSTATPSTPAPAPTATPSRPTDAILPKAPCLRAFASADLTLDSDTRTFNTTLAGHLRADEARVVIDVAMPFPEDARPAALDPWLATVAKSGGVVRSTPLTCGRGFSLGRLLQKLSDFFHGRDPPSIFDPAKKYDAVLYHDTERLVRQVVFTRRSP